MARVAKDEIDRLQREVSLERIAQSYGINLETAGAELVGRCPLHDGGERALVIEPKSNTWRCTQCAKSGSVVELVKAIEGVSLTHAIELLQAGLPGAKPIEGGVVKFATIRKLSLPMEPAAPDHLLLAQVVDFYAATLKQTPEALAYLERRGLASSELIDRFRLGFSNRTLGYRLPAKNRQAGAELRSRLQKLGVLRDTGHEHYRGSLVIPVLDDQGNVVQLYGRKITPGLRPGTPLHTWLPGGVRGVWNIDALGTGSTVIVCQSLIDALTFWCNGYRAVTALAGPDAPADELLAALQKSNVAKVLVAFRREERGDLAALALAEKLAASGIASFRVQFPKGMDANDYALKVQPAAKSLGIALRNAIWLGKGTAPAQPEIELEPAPAPMATEAAPEPPRLRPHTYRPRRQREFSPASPPAQVAPPAPPAPSPGAELPAPAPEPAQVEPVAPAQVDVPIEAKEHEVVIALGDRRYRVRGLPKNTSYESLKVNLFVSRDGGNGGFHVDTLELLRAKERAAFIKQAAQELGLAEEVVKHDLGKVLLKLEALQEIQIREALKPKEAEIILDEHERDAAMKLLTDPKLLDRVLLDFERCGVIGEESNKLVGYLAAVSRKLDDPLAVLVQSSSAAGKTSLMEAVLAFVPEEDRVSFSAMTGQSLFYMGGTNLAHKLLAIAEEEGASRAAYALKLLQSEGRLTIASTGKDPTTGRLVAQEYRVEGPVQLLLTTTAIDIDEELLNRCIVLTVDEDRRQTRAIQQLQRERQTLDGLLARSEKAQVLKLHQDAQRLLRPLPVVNPYARELTFLDDRTRTRRDHMKYLGLIRASALLYQYQRPVKTVVHAGKTIQYVEATPDDIAIANKLAHQVLGRSLDELPPQTRRLLMLLDQWVRASCEKNALKRGDFTFSRRQVREVLGWGNSQLKVHLGRLVELEYVLAHRKGQAHVYELVYDGGGQDGAPFLQGLIDASQLQPHSYEEDRPAPDAAQPGTGRASAGGQPAPGRTTENEEKAPSDASLASAVAAHVENAHPGDDSPEPSHQQPVPEES